VILAGLLSISTLNAQTPKLTMVVDSAHHIVVLTLGPYHAPAMPPITEQQRQSMDHSVSHDTPVERFLWPVQGWLRGFELTVQTGDGTALPRRILHHLLMVNYDRRQLLNDAAERVFGAGAETDDVVLPRSVGLPLAAGTRLGLYAGWHNDSGQDLHGVLVTIRIHWLPTNLNPRPVTALPYYADVNLVPGCSNAFDIPPGESVREHQFTQPIDGRLLGLGGHLHDYGEEVRLEDVATGRVIARLKARRGPAGGGAVIGLGRQLFGVTGDGVRVRAGRRYRVVARYRNPTSDTIPLGAMGHVAGLFTPDRLAEWPPVDETTVDFARDLRALESQAGHGSEDRREHQTGRGLRSSRRGR
jgi:hypothetical protein